MNKILALVVIISGAWLSETAGHAGDTRPRYEQRWFYASHNLLVDRSADDLIALIRRAGQSGYNGLMLADYKFNILDRMPARYFQNVARVREAADAAKI